MNLSTKQTHGCSRELWLPWGRESREGRKWEVGVNRCKLMEWINNKGLLYSTKLYLQYPVINHNGKEY